MEIVCFAKYKIHFKLLLLNIIKLRYWQSTNMQINLRHDKENIRN